MKVQDLYGISVFLAVLMGIALAQCDTSDSVLPSGCSYDCTESRLTCSNSGPFSQSQLALTQCSDPLVLSLMVNFSSPSTLQYRVYGPDVVSTSNSVGGVKIIAKYNRNTTHLKFNARALYTDIAVSVIPSVTLPLTPHACMCESMETVANNFHIQVPVEVPIPPITYSCTRGEQCNTVVCVINGETVTLLFNPCAEMIQVFNGNSLSGNNELAVFNQTGDTTFNIGSYPLTAHMILSNGNYSMNFSTSISVVTLQSELFQPTQVFLDRSSCGNDIVYYYPDSGPSPPGGCSPLINLPSGCQLLNNCSGFICSSQFASALLVVDKCSDPLKIDLSISASDSSTSLLKTELFINGPDVMYYRIKDFTLKTNRNTTHLSINVLGIFEGDIATTIIDNVNFPLDSHLCMCQSLAKVAKNFKFPEQFQLSIACHEDPSCLSVNCEVLEAPGNSFNFLFDPCRETVYLDSFNSSGSSSIEEDIFDRNESRPFVEDGVDFAVDVILINHNYSMTFQMSFTVLSVYTFIPIPLSQISVDRSDCSAKELRYYYPAHQSAFNLPITAIAVSVSLLGIVILAVVLTSSLCVVLYLKKRNQRQANVYSFSQLTDDDDDDEPLA